MITTRKQAIQEGLRDGHEAALDVYREELTLAQEDAQLDDKAIDESRLLGVLSNNTDVENWWGYAERCAAGNVTHRWRPVYEKALCRGAVRQSRSLLKDHEAGLLAVDLGDP